MFSDITTSFDRRFTAPPELVLGVEAVPRARVPIVKFQDRASGIMVDLSFRHGMPVYNTQLIYQYTQTHPLGVAGGGKPSLLITNYALTMMMLFHLMHRGDPIVPSLAALRCNRATYTPVFIGPWDSIEVTPDMISDECQSSSQLKEDNEVITLDDSDVSQDIEVLDIQEGLAQSENMMTNSEGTSDIEILLTTKRTPDIEILSDPQETSQDLEILASSQESVDLSQNSIKKEQELESFRKRTNENKQSCSSESFEETD
ncbi:Speckle targeted PIP5K1A-regulated poly(A) polymerase [Portunus trituberculatus]|uniref:Speckle targeted PIP5K1A-regulated poly(A) polymerase n=1 Tax=Portunus trituberculatus TaxID=210409 RepID=A0A5B7CND6_PORTR|nr:Speckle targeted PIP5K1A-regulated poly(A) polymerase [Portunus trituberculatus]